MIRRQRARHLVTWLVLLPAAGMVLVVAITVRRDDVARQRERARETRIAPLDGSDSRPTPARAHP